MGISCTTDVKNIVYLFNRSTLESRSLVTLTIIRCVQRNYIGTNCFLFGHVIQSTCYICCIQHVFKRGGVQAKLGLPLVYFHKTYQPLRGPTYSYRPKVPSNQFFQKGIPVPSNLFFKKGSMLYLALSSASITLYKGKDNHSTSYQDMSNSPATHKVKINIRSVRDQFKQLPLSDTFLLLRDNTFETFGPALLYTYCQVHSNLQHTKSSMCWRFLVKGN